MKRKPRLQFKDRLISAAKAIRARIDLGDVMFVAAVAAVGYGVAQIHVPTAWVVVGVIVGVSAMRTGGER